MKKIISILILICVLTSALVSCGNTEYDETPMKEQTEKPQDQKEEPEKLTKKEKYENALALLEEGKYEEAKALFDELGDYKNTEDYLEHFHYVITEYRDSATITISYNKENLPFHRVCTKENASSDEHYPATDTYAYDENGNLIRHIETQLTGNIEIYDYLYDENGRLIREINTNYEDHYITNYTYDEDGKLLKELYITPSREFPTTYSYDRNGNLITINDTLFKNNIVYAYDSSNRLIESVQTDASGYKTHYTYTYDENDRLIKEAVIFDSGNSETSNYTYDQKGNVVKEIKTYYDDFSKDISTVNIHYTYDKNNHLIKESIELGSTVEYVYDEHSNLIQEILTDSFGNTEVIKQYTYQLVYIDIDLPEATKELIENLDYWW